MHMYLQPYNSPFVNSYTIFCHHLSFQHFRTTPDQLTQSSSSLKLISNQYPGTCEQTLLPTFQTTTLLAFLRHRKETGAHLLIIITTAPTKINLFILGGDMK